MLAVCFVTEGFDLWGWWCVTRLWCWVGVHGVRLSFLFSPDPPLTARVGHLDLRYYFG